MKSIKDLLISARRYIGTFINVRKLLTGFDIVITHTGPESENFTREIERLLTQRGANVMVSDQVVRGSVTLHLGVRATCGNSTAFTVSWRFWDEDCNLIPGTEKMLPSKMIRRTAFEHELKAFLKGASRQIADDVVDTFKTSASNVLRDPLYTSRIA